MTAQQRICFFLKRPATGGSAAQNDIFAVRAFGQHALNTCPFVGHTVFRAVTPERKGAKPRREGSLWRDLAPLSYTDARREFKAGSPNFVVVVDQNV